MAVTYCVTARKGPSRPHAPVPIKTTLHIYFHISVRYFTCFGFRFARCRPCGAGTRRNLAAGVVGVFLHICIRAVSSAEAELWPESR